MRSVAGFCSFANIRRLSKLSKLSTCQLRFASVVSQRYSEDSSLEFKLHPAGSPKPVERVFVSRTTSERLVLTLKEKVAHFLPKGYPSTVSDGYARFAMGQSVAAVFGSVGGILSVQALLLAIG